MVWNKFSKVWSTSWWCEQNYDGVILRIDGVNNFFTVWSNVNYVMKRYFGVNKRPFFGNRVITPYGVITSHVFSWCSAARSVHFVFIPRPLRFFFIPEVSVSKSLGKSACFQSFTFKFGHVVIFVISVHGVFDHHHTTITCKIMPRLHKASDKSTFNIHRSPFDRDNFLSPWDERVGASFRPHQRHFGRHSLWSP